MGLNLDTPTLRKGRGAFFTPRPVADFLTRWAVAGNSAAKVLDPTCGDGVFLMSAAEQLDALGAASLDDQLFGADIHVASLSEAEALMATLGVEPILRRGDFFSIRPPNNRGPFPWMDAVVGNPPFIRYQQHAGADRARSARAAAAQGVAMSGLASSWAATVVHAAAFLGGDGRLAMVVPSELLSVHYAEPIRRWLQERFRRVSLVTFDRLIFADALTRVVLLLAEGSGTTNEISLYHVSDPSELDQLTVADAESVMPPRTGKWTGLLLSAAERDLFEKFEASFVPLCAYGRPTLGTVTGANDFFAINEATRRRFRISEQDLVPLCPPGTRHLSGFDFDVDDWRRLASAGERVWLLRPSADARRHRGLSRYLALGEKAGVPSAYKCRIRDPWWRPPAVPPPDLFFTYMSHRHPRLIQNSAGVTFLNSMHGVRLERSVPHCSARALPILALNAVTVLGAELHGRSYGGGILKMEPREAANLPVPSPQLLADTWRRIELDRSEIHANARAGDWAAAAKRVDDVLLRSVLGAHQDEIEVLEAALERLRRHRAPA